MLNSPKDCELLTQEGSRVRCRKGEGYGEEMLEQSIPELYPESPTGQVQEARVG